jgi:RTX calcium-binding nonapeptide repeat (4 copies)
MADFTAYEQLLLELINRSRLDPLAEAARLNIDLNAGLAAGTITSTPKMALAGNNNLVTAARNHSQHMINTDQFDHVGIGDGTPSSRMTAAGYGLTGNWATGENIAYTGTTGTPNVTTETYAIFDNLFLSESHRTNTLSEDFREVGTGIVSGVYTITDPDFGTVNFNAVMATENFGTTGSKTYVSGVAITDANGNNFYDIGEARSGITVTVTTAGAANVTDITEVAGGYSAAVNSGSHTVTFSGGGLAAPVSVTVDNGAANAKVDLSGSNKILSSVTTTLGTGAKDLVLLGAVTANGTGNDSDNIITGSRGANVLSGGNGNDTFKMVAQLNAAVDTFNGGANTDTADFSQFGAAVWVDMTYNGADAWTRDTTALTSGTYRAIADFSAVENITGTSFADSLRGNAGSNVLDGGNGIDTLLMSATATAASLDVFNGGAGTDTADFASFASAIWLDLGFAGVEAWTRDQATLASGTYRTIADLNAVENVTGTAFADFLKGDAAANTLLGGNGQDKLAMSQTASAGTLDIFNGGGDFDTVDFSSFASAVWVDLAYGGVEAWTRDQVNLSSGTYRTIADLVSIENITGSAFADYIKGAAGTNTLAGGAGADTFDYNSLAESGPTANTRDVISDFKTAGADRIDLLTIDANVSTAGVNDAFKFLTTAGAAFSGAAGEVRWYQSGGNTFVEVNTNADTVADMSIQLSGLKTLVAGDFIL